MCNLIGSNPLGAWLPMGGLLNTNSPLGGSSCGGLNDGFAGSNNLGEEMGTVLSEILPLLGQLMEGLMSEMGGAIPGGMSPGAGAPPCNGLGGMPGCFPGSMPAGSGGEAMGTPCGGGVPAGNGCQAASGAAPCAQPAAQQPAIGSLGGSQVFGDPHVTGPNGQMVNFTTDNGLFLNSDGSEVLVKSNGAKSVTSQVEVYQPGQGGAVDADPSQTDLYVNQGGQMVDLGNIGQFGIQGNGPAGQQVGPNHDATLPDGTTVKFDGAGTVQFT